jgi:ATP-dependent protease ClpP protease subunit
MGKKNKCAETLPEESGGDAAPRDFDAQVVMIIDDEIELKEEEPLALVAVKGAAPVKVQGVLNLSQSTRNVQSFKNPDVPKQLISDIRKRFKRVRNNFKKQYGPKITEIILDGKLQMAMLLDTPGGRAMLSDSIREFQQDIRRNGGEIHAFAALRAMSAGAMIFEDATVRHALPTTSFMWHVGGCIDENEGLEDDTNGEDCTDDGYGKAAIEDFKEENRAKRLSAREAFFSGAVKESKRDEVMSKLKTAEDRDYDAAVYFSGLELYDYGIVHQLAPSAAEMGKSYYDSGFCGHIAVDDFFTVTGIIEEKSRHLTMEQRHECSWEEIRKIIRTKLWKERFLRVFSGGNNRKTGEAPK